jgi:hypothetical protein
MQKKIFPLLATCALFCQASVAEAKETYQATVTVGATSAHAEGTSILNMISDLRQTELETLLPVYTPTSPTDFVYNLRGLFAISSFAANSTTLTFTLPQVGVTETFTGSTRDESLELLQEFLRDNGRNAKVLKAYAKYTPIDPMAGNPNSLMYRMAQADYLYGRLSPLSGCDCAWSSQPSVHLFQAGTDIGRAFSHEFDTTFINLPLRYSYSPCNDWSFILDVPLTLLDNGGSYSAFASLGMGLKLPLSSDWSLTPTIRLGAGGSLDLAAAAAFASTGVTSAYSMHFSSYDLTMTNYVGYFASLPFHLGGINFDYHLYNFSYKNGLTLTSCDGYEFCGKPINYSIFFTDTDFEGSSLYISHFEEVGINLIATHLNPCLDYDCLSVGFSYQFGHKNYKGYYLNMTYQF